MQAVSNLLAPFGVNQNAISDTLKLVVLGGTVETARRASMSAWNGFVDSFFLTATFSQEDYPYDWLMHWLSKVVFITQTQLYTCRVVRLTA